MRKINLLQQDVIVFHEHGEYKEEKSYIVVTQIIN